MKSKPIMLTVRRLGGMLPTLRPSKTQSLEGHDHAVLDELRSFINSKTGTSASSHPEAISYQFELRCGDQLEKVNAGFGEIPKRLHPFLPSPTDRS
jgi:hypothetical protein